MFGALRGLLAVICCVSVAAWLRCSKLEIEPKLSFIAVGQGDSAVLQSGSHTVLIDVGPRTDTFDAGERIVVPELYRLGVDSIDVVLLSHPDSDHVGGLPAIAKRFRIGVVCIPEGFRHNADMLSWLSRARISPQNVFWLDGEADFSVDRFQVKIIAPPMELGVSDNEGSMFVRIDDGLASAVLTGDAGSATEDLMASKNLDWSAQLVKAGHHGSRWSTGTNWLRKTNPGLAIISVGRNNTYGHPSALVLSRLARAHVPYLRTDQHGTATFVVGNSGFELLRR